MQSFSAVPLRNEDFNKKAKEMSLFEFCLVSFQAYKGLPKSKKGVNFVG